MQINTQDKWWEQAKKIVKSPEARQWLGFYLLVTDLDKAVEQQDDVTLARMLNKVWWRLPDDKAIHKLPHFRTLCDVCSEHEELF